MHIYIFTYMYIYIYIYISIYAIGHLGNPLYKYGISCGRSGFY
jgi:hypothetical protein